MFFSRIINLFKSGNVSVCGLRGTGKDLLIGNVICRRKKPYISNLDYTGDDLFHPLNMSDFDIKNGYKELITGNIKKYVAPIKYADIYISDAGIYLPSQYCNKLNNEYQGLVTYQAMSRQLAHSNVHFNAQNLNRVWDKVREQSDIYILCRKCFVLFGKIVIQFIRVYERYDSCCNRVRPCRVTTPLMARKEQRAMYKLYLDNFYNVHGEIKNHILIYFNKSKHDTFYFEKLFEGGK